MSIKVFFLEPTNKVRQFLRRYSREGGECSDLRNGGFHEAHTVMLGDVDVPEMPMSTTEPGEREYHMLETGTAIVENGMIGPIAVDDPRWPTQCTCGYKFQDNASKRYWPQRLYRSSADGSLHTLRDAPIGAMWHVDYTGHTGPDGKCLVVRIHGRHDWMVDSRASNCDSPCKHCGIPYHSHKPETCTNPGTGPAYTVGSYEDSRPEHRCWVRHGDAKTGAVHVDKSGVTCNAGGGSIVVPGFHGFLHNGQIVSC
jgi:hypothetical protein